MKISQTSSQRLTLRLSSWQGWLMSSLFMVVGVVGLVWMSEKAVLECDRATTGQCTLTRGGFFNQQSRSFAVASLRAVEVDANEDSDGNGSYRVLLITDGGNLPLTGAYNSNLYKNSQLADQTNRFLQTPTQSTLSLAYDRRWVGLLVLFCFGGVGLLMLLNSRVATCEFDKSTNRFAIRLWGLLGSDSRQYPLQQLLGLRVELFQDLNADSADTKRDGISSRLTLVLKNGEVMPLEKMYAGNSIKQAKLARQVHGFLRLPMLLQWNASQVVIDQGKIALPLITGGVAQRLATIETCQQTLRQDSDNVDAYQQLATALSMQGQKDQAKQLLESARGRCQSYGEFDKAAHLDHVLILLKLKGKTNWWDFT
ncbi:MAG: tetratricopeptide repeat protein [Nodosilinea sp.]